MCEAFVVRLLASTTGLSWPLCLRHVPEGTRPNTVICFLVDKLVADQLFEHFHAYKVFESNEKDVVKADSLVTYNPLQSAFGGGESQYIVPLFSL